MAESLRSRLPQESLHDAHLRACLERQLDEERQHLKTRVVESSLRRITVVLRCAGIFLILRFASPGVFQLETTEITALMTIFTLVIGSSVRTIKAGLAEA